MSCPVAFLATAGAGATVRVGDRVVEYPHLPHGSLRGPCWLCGCDTSRGALRSQVIRETFADIGRAAVPSSSVVCDHCTWALAQKALRTHSILVAEGVLSHPSRAEIRAALLDPPEPPFLLLIAVSGQKWLHFKGKVAMSRDRFPVLLEELPVVVEPVIFRVLLQVVERLRGCFTSAEIASGHYPPVKIQRYGIGRWETDEAVVSSWRGNRLLDLALHVAQKGGEDG